MYKHPDWVPIAYAIDGVDKFDAFFWEIGKHEANVIDPQHRVFTAVKLAVLPLSRQHEVDRLESLPYSGSSFELSPEHLVQT